MKKIEKLILNKPQLKKVKGWGAMATCSASCVGFVVSIECNGTCTAADYQGVKCEYNGAVTKKECANGPGDS